MDRTESVYLKAKGVPRFTSIHHSTQFAVDDDGGDDSNSFYQLLSTGHAYGIC